MRIIFAIHGIRGAKRSGYYCGTIREDVIAVNS